ARAHRAATRRGAARGGGRGGGRGAAAPGGAAAPPPPPPAPPPPAPPPPPPPPGGGGADRRGTLRAASGRTSPRTASRRPQAATRCRNTPPRRARAADRTAARAARSRAWPPRLRPRRFVIQMIPLFDAPDFPDAELPFLCRSPPYSTYGDPLAHPGWGIPRAAVDWHAPCL